MAELAGRPDRAVIATVLSCSTALAGLILGAVYFLIGDMRETRAEFTAAIAELRADMREDRIELRAAIERNGAAIQRNSVAIERNSAAIEKNSAAIERLGAEIETLGTEIAELRAIVTGAPRPAPVASHHPHHWDLILATAGQPYSLMAAQAACSPGVTGP